MILKTCVLSYNQKFTEHIQTTQNIWCKDPLGPWTPTLTCICFKKPQVVIIRPIGDRQSALANKIKAQSRRNSVHTTCQVITSQTPRVQVVQQPKLQHGGGIAYKKIPYFGWLCKFPMLFKSQSSLKQRFSVHCTHTIFTKKISIFFYIIKSMIKIS